MVNEHKLWAHYERLKFILGLYIILFFLVPFSTFCISFLAHSKEIDTVAQEGIALSVQGALRWYAIIMPIITVLFIIWFLCYSDTVEFTDSSIKYYRWIFSKKTRNISYNEITECVFSDGLWRHKGGYKYGRKISIYNRNKIILVLGLYYKLCLLIVLKLSDEKVRLAGENRNLKTLDSYFKIDFKKLSYEQQKLLLKFYCKFSRNKYKTGEEILKRQKV